MDHSYSTERERLQKSDHCYFTVAKKTPEVVLRKARQLKEQAAQECRTKSAVGQDHSYVRADHAVQLVDDEDLEHAQLLLDLFHYQQRGMCEAPATLKMETSAEDDSVTRQSNAEPSQLIIPSPDSVNQKLDVDDLHCWMGCIQLDHAYDSPSLLASAVSTCHNAVDSSVILQTDHAYELHRHSGARKFVRNRSAPPDHVYVQYSSPPPPLSVSSADNQCEYTDGDHANAGSTVNTTSLCADTVVQNADNSDDVNCVVSDGYWDHAYNVRHNSATSLSATPAAAALAPPSATISTIPTSHNLVFRDAPSYLPMDRRS